MTPRISNRKSSAMTLTEVLVVIAVLALLVILLLPALNHAKAKAQLISCNGNLKEINIGFKIWEGDHANLYPMSISTNFGGTLEYITTGQTFKHFQIISNELGTPKILVCPADVHQPAKDFGSTFSNTNISYFVGVDAVEPKPPQYLFAQMFVSGDDNFEINGFPIKSGLLNLSSSAPISWTATRHITTGNIGLADGSVQQLTQDGLLQVIQQTGVATNRLAIP